MNAIPFSTENNENLFYGRWISRRIKMVADVRYGLGQPPERNAEGLPIIRATNVSRGRITEKDLIYVDPDDLPLGRDPYLKTGEIIVVRSGAYTGDSAIIPDKWSGSVVGYDMVLSATRCDPNYLAYCLLSDSVLDAQILLLTQRAAQPHLNANELGNVIVHLPENVLEQKRIAAYLDASCSAIARAVETKQKQLETLDALRKSIIQKAVTQGLNPDAEMKNSRLEMLGKIPTKWRVRRLKALSDIRYGLGQPPAQKDDGLPILRATNVTRGKITEKGLIRVDPEDLPAGRDPYLAAGEIIVVRSGAYTADSAIISKEWAGSIAGYDMVVTARRSEPRFLAYALLSNYVLRDQLLLMTLRAAQPHLNANELGSVKIVVPERIPEQTEICDYLDRRMQELDKVRDNISSQITTLTAYRKSLIHECVTGKRRITDADLAKVEAYV